MALDNNIQITITGKDEASPAIKAAGQSLADLQEEYKRLQAESVRIAGGGAKPFEDVAAGAAAAVPAVETLGVTGAAAGTAIDVAFAPIIVTIGLIVAAAAGLAVALSAVVSAGVDLVKTADSWAGMSKDIAEANNVSTEFAGTLGYIAKLSGDVPEKLGAQVSKTVEVIGATADKLNEIDDARAVAQTKHAETAATQEQQLLERRTDDERRHADTVVSIQRSAGQAQSDFADRMAEREADLLRTRERDATASAQRLADLAENHARSVLSIEQNIDDARADFADQEQQRQERMAERLENFDDSHTQRRESIQQRVAGARDEFERKALQGQLAEFDRATAEERQKIVAKADEEERRAREQEDKRIKRLQQRIDAENDAYAKQVAKLAAQDLQREKDKQESYDRDTARLEKAMERQSAAVGARIQAEEAAYARIEAAREAAAKKQADANDEVLRKSNEALDKSSPKTLKAFEDLGLKFEDLKKLSPEEKFLAVATALSKVDDEFKQMDLMKVIYGQGGIKELNHFVDELGIYGFDVLAKRATALGKTMSGQTVEDFEAARKKLAELELQFEGLKTEIGIALLPVWDELLTKAETFWKDHGPEIVKLMNGLTTDVIPKLVGAVDGLDKGLQKISESPFWKILVWIVTAGADYTSFMTRFGQSLNSVFGSAIATTQATPERSYTAPGAGASPGGSVYYPPGTGPASPDQYVTTILTNNQHPGGATTSGAGLGGGPNAPDAGGGNVIINQTNNYPSPPVTKDEALGYLLMTYGFGGRK